MPEPDAAAVRGRARPARRRPLAAIVLAMLATLSGADAAEVQPFEVRSADVRLAEGVFLLDAVARLRLSPPVRQALHSGVDLVIHWQIEIVRERGWWPDAEVAELNQRYRLAYHALSRQYLVTNLNTGERRSFVALNLALGHMGHLYEYPLVDRMLLAGPARHTGRAQVRLDHGALPWALRPTALFASAWNLASEWRAWSFE